MGSSAAPFALHRSASTRRSRGCAWPSSASRPSRPRPRLRSRRRRATSAPRSETWPSSRRRSRTWGFGTSAARRSMPPSAPRTIPTPPRSSPPSAWAWASGAARTRSRTAGSGTRRSRRRIPRRSRCSTRARIRSWWSRRRSRSGSIPRSRGRSCGARARSIPRVESGARAIGLMQMLAPTAQKIAGLLGEKELPSGPRPAPARHRSSARGLVPGRARRTLWTRGPRGRGLRRRPQGLNGWMEKNGNLPFDEFVEAIPFPRDARCT